jgi:hypothetical protein
MQKACHKEILSGTALPGISLMSHWCVVEIHFTGY